MGRRVGIEKNRGPFARLAAYTVTETVARQKLGLPPNERHGIAW